MPQKKWLQLTGLIFILAGCSYNPFSSDNHLTGKPVGAAIGGTVGAGTAALTGASQTGVALTGLGGAAIGYYFTTREFISGGIKRVGGDVLVQGDCITVALPTARLFENNSSRLRPEAAPALNSTIQVLNDFPDNDIIVAGNSTGFGTQRDEKKMTQLRAQEVAGYLWAHGISGFQSNGITKRSLIVVGYGYHRPVATFLTPSGLYANKRIQISSCPSTCDLSNRITNGTGGNVGNADFTSENAETATANFKGDHLPAVPDNPPDNFRPAIQDKDTTSHDFKGIKS